MEIINIGGKMKKDKDIIEGIIIKADYGYGMKYKDENELYLKLEIQMFDGYQCVELFRGDKIEKILLQFKGDYIHESSISTLLHRTIYLLNSEQTQNVPDAISVLPPHKHNKYNWIYNDS